MNRPAASTLPLLAALACLAAGGAWAKSPDRNQQQHVSADSSACPGDGARPCPPPEDWASPPFRVPLPPPASTMRGTGMRADLATNRIQLLSKVTMSYEPTRR